MITGRGLHFKWPPLAASVVTVCGVSILCGLGTWQVNRLAEKEAFLKQIELETQKPPAPLQFQDLSEKNLFRRGSLNGHWLADRTVALIPRTYEGVPGAHLYAPLKLAEGQIVMVNRGWAPNNFSETALPLGLITVYGEILSWPQPNPFTPANPEAKSKKPYRHWYRLDKPALKTLFPDGEIIAPVILRAENPQEHPNSKQEVRPITQATKVEISNNHEAYAAFWYGMAVILSAVFLLRFVLTKR